VVKFKRRSKNKRKQNKNKNKTWRRWHEIRKMSKHFATVIVIEEVSPNLENNNKRQRQVFNARDLQAIQDSMDKG